MSPILANIYLSELDNYMEKYKQSFDIGDCTKRIFNKEYTQLNGKYCYAIRKYARDRAGFTKEERKEKLKPILKLLKQCRRELTKMS